VQVYPDEEMRLAINRAVALVSHRIDVVVALAQAALGSARSAKSSSISRNDGSRNEWYTIAGN
jgi:hypothetical protein